MCIVQLSNKDNLKIILEGELDPLFRQMGIYPPTPTAVPAKVSHEVVIKIEIELTPYFRTTVIKQHCRGIMVRLAISLD
jgi:hypothetical protein